MHKQVVARKALPDTLDAPLLLELSNCILSYNGQFSQQQRDLPITGFDFYVLNPLSGKINGNTRSFSHIHPNESSYDITGLEEIIKRGKTRSLRKKRKRGRQGRKNSPEVKLQRSLNKQLNKVLFRSLRAGQEQGHMVFYEQGGLITIDYNIQSPQMYNPVSEDEFCFANDKRPIVHDLRTPNYKSAKSGYIVIQQNIFLEDVYATQNLHLPAPVIYENTLSSIAEYEKMRNSLDSDFGQKKIPIPLQTLFFLEEDGCYSTCDFANASTHLGQMFEHSQKTETAIPHKFPNFFIEQYKAG